MIPMAVDLSLSAWNKKGTSLLATQACPQLSAFVTWHSHGTLMVKVWLCRRAQDQVHLCARSFRLLLPARCQNRRQHMGRKRHTCCRFHHRICVCHSDKQLGCTHHLSAALPGCRELRIRMRIHPPRPAGLGFLPRGRPCLLQKGASVHASMRCKDRSSLAGHPPCSSFARCLRAQRPTFDGHACSATASPSGCKPIREGLCIILPCHGCEPHTSVHAGSVCTSFLMTCSGFGSFCNMTQSFPIFSAFVVAGGAGDGSVK